MNASLLSRIASIVPERVARLHSGTGFDPRSAASPHPDRLAHLAVQLNWMTPLVAQDKAFQQQLGLLSSAGRLLHEAADDGESLPEEAEDAVA